MGVYCTHIIKMRVLFTSIVLCGLFYTATADASVRDPKAFGLFNIVKFPNIECHSKSTTNGTCYTKEECDNKKGTASGTCAKGYGVCCLFTLGCGQSSSENITTFHSVGSIKAGACNAEICPVSKDIVQLRLDFTSFVINGPTTASTTTFALLNGAVVAPGNAAYSQGMSHIGQCNADSFSVTSPGGVGTPVICGTNTGDHIYVDASPSCNTLSFHIGSATSTVSRKWSIHVNQYAENYHNKAPPGCLQYHFGATTGTFRSFNWNSGSGVHLASQNQLICFRREAKKSKICFTGSGGTANEFMISGGGATTATGKIGSATTCGTYGTISTSSSNIAGQGTDYDFLHIPFASTSATTPVPLASNSNFCGQCLVQASATCTTASNRKTICTKSLPFQVRFVSDAGETVRGSKAETAANQKGFNLHFIQT